MQNSIKIKHFDYSVKSVLPFQIEKVFTDIVY